MVLNRHAFGVLGLVLARATLSQAYYIQDSYVGQDFYNSWTWETLDDPTHGRVNYVDKWTAINNNLSYGMHYSYKLIPFLTFSLTVSHRQQVCHACRCNQYHSPRRARSN